MSLPEAYFRLMNALRRWRRKQDAYEFCERMGIETVFDIAAGIVILIAIFACLVFYGVVLTKCE